MINKIILLNAIFKNDLKKLKGELDQLSKEESNIDELISSLNTLLKDRLYDAKQQNLELLQSNPAKLVNMLSIFLEFQIKIKQASDVQLKKAIFEVACYRIITQLHYSNSNLINLDHNQQKYQATSKNSRSTKIIKNLEPNNHRYIDRYLHIHHRDSYEGVDFTGIIKNGILNIVDQCWKQPNNYHKDYSIFEEQIFPNFSAPNYLKHRNILKNLLDHPDTLPDDLFIISTIKTIGPCTKNTIVLVFENVVKEAVFTFWYTDQKNKDALNNVWALPENVCAIDARTLKAFYCIYNIYKKRELIN